SEEKREPASDIDTALVDSLKALDPKRPIREANIDESLSHVRKGPELNIEPLLVTCEPFHLLSSTQSRVHLGKLGRRLYDA
ncbi:MAG: hypothetical protein ACM3Z4_21310, partial [Hyphomicrobiales bacterium]